MGDSDAGAEWLRGRGIGRERLAGHIGDFLAANGYRVDRAEEATPPETVVRAELSRQNPAVPDGARRLELRLVPTSGGCAVRWIAPVEVPAADRPRFLRLVRELLQHLERSVSTGSHGTAKVARPPGLRMPWESGEPGVRPG